MVILLTRIYTGEDRAELKAEADRIAEEFKTLWRIKFKDVGYDKFIERLYKLFA